jgi:hypothetical protein
MSSLKREDPPTLGFLRCIQCGTRIPCTQAKVIEHAKFDSWPLCCGQIMLFYGGDQATAEMPALQTYAD